MTLSEVPNGMTWRTSIASGMNGPLMVMPWRICAGVVDGVTISRSLSVEICDAGSKAILPVYYSL